MTFGRAMTIVCVAALALVGLVLGHPVYCGFAMFCATLVAATASKDND